MTTATRERSAETRRKVFEHYGQLCACCGSGNHLSIDHIHGDGGDHRKIIGGSLYAWLVMNNYPDGFQTLCRSCNSSKHTDQECKIHGNMFAYEIGHRAWRYVQIENSRVHVLGEILGYRIQKAQQAETALACIRRTIGSHPRYDDLRACLDVQKMTAAEMEAVTSMTADEMISRWAPGTGRETGYR